MYEKYVEYSLDRMPLVLACSPRRGNCDFAASLLARSLGAERGFPNLPPFFLRHCAVQPCISCGCCSPAPGQENFVPFCPVAEKDESKGLFKALVEASELFLVAPIYFYHLPAQLKALIDRSQFYYNNNQLLPARKKPVKTVLISGREKGKKLFEGSLLSLKYFYKAIGREEATPPLLLRGLDGPQDLETRADLQGEIFAYARP